MSLDYDSSLSLGADMTDTDGTSVGMVVHGGQLYTQTKPETHQSLINRGSKSNRKCILVISAGYSEGQNLQQMDAVRAAGKKVAGSVQSNTYQKVKL